MPLCLVSIFPLVLSAFTSSEYGPSMVPGGFGPLLRSCVAVTGATVSSRKSCASSWRPIGHVEEQLATTPICRASTACSCSRRTRDLSRIAGWFHRSRGECRGDRSGRGFGRLRLGWRGDAGRCGADRGAPAALHRPAAGPGTWQLRPSAPGPPGSRPSTAANHLERGPSRERPPPLPGRARTPPRRGRPAECCRRACPRNLTPPPASRRRSAPGRRQGGLPARSPWR
jgi:hypothetical protein